MKQFLSLSLFRFSSVRNIQPFVENSIRSYIWFIYGEQPFPFPYFWSAFRCGDWVMISSIVNYTVYSVCNIEHNTQYTPCYSVIFSEWVLKIGSMRWFGFLFMISVCVFRLFTFSSVEYPDFQWRCVFGSDGCFIYISVSGSFAVVAACYLFRGTFVFIYRC